MKIRVFSLMALLAILIMAVTFAGCTSPSSNDDSTKTVQTSTPVATKSTTLPTTIPTTKPTTKATTVPTPKPTTVKSAVCSCSGDIYNCGDFSSHSEAQACYDYCKSIGKGDIHKLDNDKDGDACESL